MRLRTLWPRLTLARYHSRQHPSPFWRFSLELNTRIKSAWITPRAPFASMFSSRRLSGSHFTRHDQTILGRFRNGHFKTMKFSEGCKSFEMSTDCSSEPASPDFILECLRLTKQDLADNLLPVFDFLKV
ncbi:uncharacterized protein TNCV_3887621 [Trichonephila clavipes]|nr:uncharacterized protein TNCV_3887621 [Trichonephila clavipes]